MTAQPIRTDLPSPGAMRTPAIRRAHLLTALTGLVSLDAVLLLPFLGAGAIATGVAALLACAVIAAMHRAGRADNAEIPVGRLLSCLALAAMLLMLGGEGGLFYANPDWQVRNAVLGDMTAYAWPFAYRVAGADALLRAPIGMYLVPALLAKATGGAGIWLLVQNSLAAGLSLAIGSTLFKDRRARRIAAAVVIGFSGMDALGAALIQPALLASLDAHLEAWAGLQFSSTITLLFWVPQHGLSGWIGALLYLLWRRRAISLSAFLMPLPLLALWSPFGVAGILPFAGIAAIASIAARGLRATDILLPGVSTLLAIPSLAYMTAGSASVGVVVTLADPRAYGCVESFEVLPFLLLLAGSRRSRAERIELAVIAAVLFIAPVIWVGRNCDFMMRASIPALTMLAVRVAEVLIGRRKGAAALIAILAIGAVTPLHEIARALLHRPAPAVRCTLIKAFDQTYAEQGISQYVAPVAAFPPALRPHGVHPVPTDEGRACWDRPWMSPR